MLKQGRPMPHNNFFINEVYELFLHTRQRPDRKDIQMEWIKQVYEFPNMNKRRPMVVNGNGDTLKKLINIYAL